MCRSDIKILAMYLPQFHRIKENDWWWGDGYTEWTAVKMAKRLFAGHNQPKIPLENNYYNLLDKDTMIWQASLAREYRVDGFCFYHYWFDNNKKILEKPAENLLKWKDVDMPFCFCWPTEPWSRTWSKFGQLGNSWASAFESPTKVTDDGILLDQVYGDEVTWRQHFEYLLPFFKDERYIKVDDKPVFWFRNFQPIPCLEQMVVFWKKLAKENGFPGLYIISFLHPNYVVDAVVNPMLLGGSIWYPGGVARKVNESLTLYDYDDVWENYLGYLPSSINKTLWMGMVSFDNTPRHGNRGSVLEGCSPEKFKRNFECLLAKSIENGNPFVFINAWNEWGEGMYLEPDTVNGLTYLEKVREVIDNKENAIHQWGNNKPDNSEKYFHHMERTILQLNNQCNILSEWLQLKLDKRSIAEYLESINCNRIIIYGFGKYGKLLKDDLHDSDITIIGIIDRRANLLKDVENMTIYTPNEQLPECDAIIVSVIKNYDRVLLDMKNKVKIPVMSLYELLYRSRQLNK